MSSDPATKSEARKPACRVDADGNFSTIVRSNQNWLRAAAGRRLGGNALVDDAVQSVFVALWSRYEPPHNDGSRLRSWLARTIQHTCNNLRRNERRQLAHLQKLANTRSGSTQPAAEGQADGEHIAALDAALQQLSPTDRSLLAARFYQGQSIREVAQQFGITEAAAKKRINRAIERLRSIVRRRYSSTNLQSSAALSFVGSDAVLHEAAEMVAKSTSWNIAVLKKNLQPALKLRAYWGRLRMVAGIPAVPVVVAVALVLIFLMPPQFSSRMTHIGPAIRASGAPGTATSPPTISSAVPSLWAIRHRQRIAGWPARQGGTKIVAALRTVSMAWDSHARPIGFVAGSLDAPNPQARVENTVLSVPGRKMVAK